MQARDYKGPCFRQEDMIMATLKILGAVAALATVGASLTIGPYPQTAQAQTQGSERRTDRRDTRQDSREVKQACKAGDEKTRSECRQGKRDVKQSGRQGETPPASEPRPAGSSPP